MRLTVSEKVYKTICYTVAIIVALASLYPLLYTLFVSLCSKDEWTARNGLLLFLPSNPTLTGYSKVLGNGAYVLKATLVSVARSVLGTFLCVFFNVCVGYALSRENLPGRKTIMMFLLITMLFGGGLIPGYLTIKQVGLLNNFWCMVIPSIMSAWNVLIFKQFFEGVPKSLQEAAVIDGAGEFRLMTQVIMPMSKAVIAAIALFSFVGHWNSWFDAMIYIDNQHSELWPLQLYTMLNFNNLNQINQNPDMLINSALASEVNTMSMKMALTIVTLIPVLVIYPFFQKYFSKGVYTGAVKG